MSHEFGELFGNYNFRSLSKNFSDLWRKIFGIFVKTAFYMSWGTFWGKILSSECCIVHVQGIILKINIFLKNSYFFECFLNFSGKFWDFWRKKFRKDCQNCILRVQKNMLKKNEFFEKNISSFSDFEQKISHFEWKVFCTVVKTAFYMSRGTFGLKKSWTCSPRIGISRRKWSTYWENDFPFIIFTTENKNVRAKIFLLVHDIVKKHDFDR